MALSTKTIKQRLKSIGNTKKITKAMEMISAVKMRRAVAHVTASRHYSLHAEELLSDITRKTKIHLHPLLAARPVKKCVLIFITSNRGLAGGFNSKLLQEAHSYIKKSGVPTDIILLGKKGRKMYYYFGHPVTMEFEKVDVTAVIEEILPLAQTVSREYIEKKYDRVVVAYTHFYSAIKQVPVVKQVLPFKEKTNDNSIRTTSPKAQAFRFKFEPNAVSVLNALLPRLVEMQIYQATLESDASEHSARMLAMRNATDAAKDMIKEFTMSFNKARQAGITQEISEIVGGAAALE